MQNGAVITGTNVGCTLYILRVKPCFFHNIIIVFFVSEHHSWSAMALLTPAQRLHLMNVFLMVQQHAADSQAVAQLLHGRRRGHQQQRRRHWLNIWNVWHVRETDGRNGARRLVRVPKLYLDGTSPVLWTIAENRWSHHKAENLVQETSRTGDEAGHHTTTMLQGIATTPSSKSLEWPTSTVPNVLCCGFISHE